MIQFEKPEILFEDEDLIVVKKPAGMASQEERGRDPDMVSFLKNHLVKSGYKGQPYIAVIHRLDKPVGGLLVYAKNKQTAAALSSQLQTAAFGKCYLAVLTGRRPSVQGTLTDLMIRDPKTNTSHVAMPGEKGEIKKAVLDYEVLSVNGSALSLVRIRLHTGRHHQIRVQMAHAGAGIYGDTKYNPLFRNQKNGWHELALFSDRLTFKHPKTGKEMTFTAEPGNSILKHFPEQ